MPEGVRLYSDCTRSPKKMKVTEWMSCMNFRMIQAVIKGFNHDQQTTRLAIYIEQIDVSFCMRLSSY